MFGDDLVSLVSSAFTEEDEEGTQHDTTEESELKFDPNAVKTELIVFDADGSQIDDDFLRSINADDEILDTVNVHDAQSKSGGGTGEETPTKGKGGDSTSCRRSRRSTKRTVNPLSLDLYEDDDDDEDWRRGSSKNRKKSAGVKSKKRKVQRRKLWSDDTQKERKRSPKKKASDGMNEEELASYGNSQQKDADNEKVRKVSSKSKKKSNKGDDEFKPRRGSSGGGRRKKVAEMTEEEREVMKAKWREEARLKRERQRQKMTPEEREEYLRRHREQRRMQRALQKIAMTEAEREELNKKARERKREKRSQLTAEEKKERAQRVTLRRLERLATMTEEEKAQYRMNNYMSYMARVSRMSQEEIEQRKKKRREYARKRLEKLTEDDKEKRRQRIRQYRWNMDPDRKERFLSQLREGYRRRVERLKAAGKWDEVKEKWRRENKEKKKQGGDVIKRRRSGPRLGKRARFADETPEQRAARLKEQRRRNQQKAKIKKKLAIQEMLDQGMSMEEINRQMETPEQREHRLMKSRINKAKLDLRKRLLSSGAAAEEIQVKLNELAATYQPSRNFRPYKPRPETWKPIEPEDLKLLAEEPSPPKPKSKTLIVGTTIIDATPKIQVEFQLQPESESIQYFHPNAIASPVATSSCSYVSASATPEPVTILQAYPSQNQCPTQAYEASNLLYPSQTSQTFATNTHPSVSVQSQSQPYSLQQMIDTMNYQEVHPVSMTVQNTVVVFQQPPKIPDYCSSYDASSPPYVSAPSSPDLVLKDEISATSSIYGGDSSQNYSTIIPASAPAAETVNFDASCNASPTKEFKRRRGRPRKGDPPVIKPPKKGGRRIIGQPIGALHKDVVRNSICDECGNAYSSVYLQEHKRNFHNPHYKNGECTICGEKFKQSRNFYKHYKEVHCNKNIPLPNGEKKYQCEGCGRAFQQEGNMRKHWYYMHGPGRLTENFHRCHLCPGEKFFKQKLTLLTHFKRCHPDYNPGVYKCSRCTENFPNESQLNEHVHEKHPEAYWPCKFCRSVKYSELGIKFHYSNGCLKIPKDEWVKMRKEIGDNSIERLQVQCEFCDRVVCLMNLKRHYWEMHNVEEEKFPCIKCDKTFKRREYLGAHIVDYHNMQPEEWLDIVRKLNVKDRDKVEVKNLEGKQGGAPLNPLRKPDVEEKIRTSGGRLPRKGGRKKKGAELAMEEEGGQTDGEQTPKVKKRRGRPPGKKFNSKATPKKKRRGRPKKKLSSDEEEEDMSETEDDEDIELDEERRSHGKGKRNRSSNEEGSENEDSPQRRSGSETRGILEDDSIMDDHDREKHDQDVTSVDTVNDPIQSKSFNPAVPLSSLELDNVVKTEVLSDEEDVHIAWIYKD